MEVPDYNIFAILGAFVLYMAIGSVWYMPHAFGNRWMKLKNIKKNDISNVLEPMLWSALAGLVIAFAIAFGVSFANANNFSQGMFIGFLTFLPVGFTGWNNVVFSSKKDMEARKQLFFIDYGYPLLAFVLMGGILAMF